VPIQSRPLSASVFTEIVWQVGGCRDPQRHDCISSPRLMPSGPAFGVKPRMSPRLGPERQDHGGGKVWPATPSAASRRWWRVMLVQPLDDASFERPVLELLSR